MGTRIDDGGAGGAWDAWDFGDVPADEHSLEAASFDEPATDLPEAAAVDDATDAWTEPRADHEAPPASVEDTFGWPEHAQARAEVADFSCTAEGGEGEPEPELDAASHAVVVGKGQGVLAALRASGIPDPDLPAAYGALVRDGQLKPSEFVRGTPVVQPGRTFEVDPRALDDDAAALGRRLIGTEHRTRATVVVAAAAPAPAPASPVPAARSAAPRPASAVAAVPPQPAQPAAESVSSNYDKVVLAPWENFKQQVRDDNAAVQASDDGALGIASKVVAVPRELGFGLIDTGLGLGRGVVGVAESVAGGTVAEDAKRVFGAAWGAVSDYGVPDHWRLSVSRGDNKVMVGTDRIGVQYKQKPAADAKVQVDQVTRLTHRWGDKEQFLRAEALLEKNFDVAPTIPVKGSVAGVPVQGINVVPGLRQNLTGSGAVTPSLNVDVLLPGKVKVSLEMRQSGG